MSLIDTRFPDLDLFLQRWQRRLNTRLLAGEALAAWTAAAPAVLAVSLFLDRSHGLALGVWGFTVALAALGFTLWRTRRRLSRHQAASWLDDRGRTFGLYRAASECLDQEPLGQAGARVLHQADQRMVDFRGSAGPRLPWRRLAARAVLALTLSAGAVLVLSLAPPLAGFPVSGSENSASLPAGPEALPDDPGGGRELTPREAAERLFPEDPRLAALAEQALASGDPQALDSLLEQSAEAMERARQLPGGAVPRQGSEDGAAQKEQTPAAPGVPGTPAPGGKRKAGSSDPSSSGQDGQSPPEGSGSQGRSQDKPGTSAPRGLAEGPSNRSPGQGPGEGSGGDQVPLSSGGAPGEGHSDEALESGITRGDSSRRLSLKEPESQGIFEYILPGKGSKLPSAQALADSRRSAEALISRTAPPLEFENTIRDYFLSLTSPDNPQEASP